MILAYTFPPACPMIASSGARVRSPMALGKAPWAARGGGSFLDFGDYAVTRSADFDQILS